MAESSVNASDPFSPTSDELNPPDVILRSSDLVDFYAHKAILSFRSLFFRNMFSFPHPVGEEANPMKDGIPVAALPESSKALEKLLLLCYPRLANSYRFRDLDGVSAAYEAAKKYEISDGRGTLEAVLVDPRFLEQETYRVFAIACHCALEHVAKLAAMETLKKPRLDSTLSEPPEFELISAQRLWRLGLFHTRCSKELAGVMSNIYVATDEEPCPPEQDPYPVWWDPRGHNAGCGPREEPDFPEFRHPAKWFADHMRRIREACLVHPDVGRIAQNVTEMSEPTLVAIASCPKCVKHATECLRITASDLEDQATRRIGSILATFSFTT
ncbi:hypothetical protein GGX14DRAFT_596634 [Mycena pura]|uniref:BTB domain-containing protein n=1 Tax=Mycena pura TaxID=153505 RepID=A0AAD6UWM8_9AGAR|nr:hypothetical protein GGX14DRAFT_596634 [Mycena pura]